MLEKVTCRLFGIPYRVCLFQLAIEMFDVESIETILSLSRAKRFLNKKFDDGRTFVHIAASTIAWNPKKLRKKLEILDLIMYYSTRHFEIDKEGNTALHIATDIDSARYLMNAGLDPSAKNYNERLPEEVTIDEELHFWFRLQREQQK